jgi:hypothetical protein
MMDNDIMKEQGLRDIYYNPKSGFQTPEKLYLRAISDGLEVTRNQVLKSTCPLTSSTKMGSLL